MDLKIELKAATPIMASVADEAPASKDSKVSFFSQVCTRSSPNVSGIGNVIIAFKLETVSVVFNNPAFFFSAVLVSILPKSRFNVS